MRPHKPATKSRARAVARARLLVKAKLWWLSGYPRAGEWMYTPLRGERASESLTLGRTHLRQAVYAVKKLRGEFPKALPEIVGNAQKWEARVRHIIERLKPVVHSSAPAPVSLFDDRELYSAELARRADRLCGEESALEPVVGALSWVLATDPAAATRTLRWLEQHGNQLRPWLAAQLPGDQQTVAVQLAAIAPGLGPGGATPLLRLFAEPAIYNYPIKGGTDYILRLRHEASPRRDPAPAVPPAATLPGHLGESVAWLVARDRKTRRQFFALLAELRLEESARRWGTWWAAAIPVAEKIRRLRSAYLDDTRLTRERGTLHRRLDQLNKELPSPLRVGHVIAAAREFAEAPRSWTAALKAVLSNVRRADQPALPAAFLVHWRQLLAREEQADKLMPVYLRELARYAALPRADLTPWAQPVLSQGARGRYSFTVDSDILDGDLRSRDIPRAFAGFVRFSELRPQTPLGAAAESIVELVALCHDGALAADLTAQLDETGQLDSWRSQDAQRAALAASAEERALFADLLAAFARLEEDTELSAMQVYEPLESAFAQVRPVMLRALLSGERALLEACARRLSLLRAVKHPFAFHGPDQRGRPTWVKSYPKPLWHALRELAQVDSSAEITATRITGKLLPNRDALQEQIRALERQLASDDGETASRKRARLDNLRARLASPPTVSEAKLHRLRDRLERAAARALLVSAREQASAAVGAAATNLLGVASPPEWLLAERNLRLLAPIFELAAGSRRLALRLLRVRAGPPPWDLRDAKANLDFLENLTELGLDTAPWVDGIGSIAHESKKGTILLAFTDDPLEVFRMGEHFQTCLSPGAFNYFSVFANAADINKRVLYARDREGRVVGRRLVCLTERGAILAFHPYSHDGAYGFGDASSRFIAQLAREMGTVTMPRGSVPKLVARHWYDDGPVDVARQFAFLEDGSAFRDALPSMAPEEFVAHLRKACRQLHMEKLVLPLVLALPEVSSRPKLAAALIAQYRLDAISSEHCLRAALLLAAAGDTAAASHLAGRIAHHVMSSFRQRGWYDPEAIQFLARHRPSLALRTLRETRARGVRTWRDETDGARLYAAGLAMLHLGRRKQARSVFELAAGRGGEYRQEAAKQAARLG